MCSRAERKRRRRAVHETVFNGKPCAGTIEVRLGGEVFGGITAINYFDRRTRSPTSKPKKERDE